MGALNEEVLDIGEGVGQAPGDLFVVADDNAGRAGERGAADVDAAVGAVQVRTVGVGTAGRGAGEVHLVPCAGHCHDQVGIVTEDRTAAGGLFR